MKSRSSLGTALNDKDYINSLLSSLKDMEKIIQQLTEASNETLSKYKKCLILMHPFKEVYELMFRKGWYVLEKAEENKINSKYNCLNQEFNDLSN